MIVDEDRKKARERAQVIGDLLKTADGREALSRAGHKPSGYLVAAHCDELMGEVMARVTAARSADVVLVAYEGLRRSILLFQPGHDDDVTEQQPIGAESKLGLLVDAMASAGPGTAWNVTVSAWRTAIATNNVPELQST